MGPLLKKQSFEGTALSLLKQVIYSQEENIKTTPILFSGGSVLLCVLFGESICQNYFNLFIILKNYRG